MISTLEELQAFTQSREKIVPLIADRMVLHSPGCGDDAIHQLLDLEPQLPPVYIRCIKRFALKGIGLSGHFSLWPGGQVRKGTFTDDFRKANSPGWYFGYEKIASFGMCIVGSWAGCMIAVGKVGSPVDVDSVYMFLYDDPEQNPIRLCADFEKFLLAAGNVAELFVSKEMKDRELALLDRLRAIGLSEQEIKIWHMNTDGLFGESSTTPKWRD